MHRMQQHMDADESVEKLAFLVCHKN
jgi:hypothetical protein